MARPMSDVDEVLLQKLAAIHLPDKYIAQCLNISVETLHRRFSEKIDRHKSEGKAKLLSMAWAKADKGDWPAIKFLLQNYLKMSDRVETSLDDATKNFVYAYTKDSLKND